MSGPSPVADHARPRGDAETTSRHGDAVVWVLQRAEGRISGQGESCCGQQRRHYGKRAAPSSSRSSTHSASALLVLVPWYLYARRPPRSPDSGGTTRVVTLVTDVKHHPHTHPSSSPTPGRSFCLSPLAAAAGPRLPPLLAVPAALGQCTKLTKAALHLHSNQLTGPVPSALRGLIDPCALRGSVSLYIAMCT